MRHPESFITIRLRSLFGERQTEPNYRDRQKRDRSYGQVSPIWKRTRKCSKIKTVSTDRDYRGHMGIQGHR